MSKKGNEKKAEQLGMPYGTASNILKKKLLFDFVKKSKLNYCYRCGKEINNIDDLSIEHKEPWLDTENPIELFFDLDNVAYSHLSCNCSSIRKEYCTKNGKRISKYNIDNRIKAPDGMSYCWNCKEFKNKSEFQKDKTRFNGLNDECKRCKQERRKKYSGVV